MRASEAKSRAQLVAARRLVGPVLKLVEQAADRGEFRVDVNLQTMPPRGPEVLREYGYVVASKYTEHTDPMRSDIQVGWTISWN